MATNLHQEPLSDQLRRGVDELKGVREDAADLFQDLRVLAQKEMELARAEMKEQVAYGRNAAILAGVAAVVALLTLAFFAVTAMFALDEVMDTWLAALITALGLLTITAIAGLLAYSQIKQITVAPKKTMQSVNEDVQWARDRMSFSAR